MPVPKRKVSRARRDKRKANLGLKPQALSFCFSGVCKGEPKLPHIVCEKCGFYRGKKVLRTKMDRELSRNEKRGARASDKIKEIEVKKDEPKGPKSNKTKKQ